MTPPAEPTVRWFLTRKAVIAALIIVGPLGLPFLWFSPKFTRFAKLWISALTVVLTFVMMKMTAAMLNDLQAKLAALRNESTREAAPLWG